MPESVSDDQRQRFQRLIWPWLADVLRFAKYLTHDDAEAEDLAQETMMRALRGIDGFEEGTDARAWLFTLERRLFIDRHRPLKNRRLASLDHERAAEPVAPADEHAGIFDEQWSEPEDLLRRFSDQEVIDALKELPDDIRWTLLLVDVEGVDHADAAAILEAPPGTIKSRAHRGRRMLRDRLFSRAQARGWVVAGSSRGPGEGDLV